MAKGGAKVGEAHYETKGSRRRNPPESDCGFSEGPLNFGLVQPGGQQAMLEVEAPTLSCCEDCTLSTITYPVAHLVGSRSLPQLCC